MRLRNAQEKFSQEIGNKTVKYTTLKVRDFFDKESIHLDIHVESDPILSYEQKMRHEAVIELVQATQGDTVLDVGCGNLRDISRLARQGIECVGVDLSKGMIQEGLKKIKKNKLKNVDLLIGSATNLPLRKETFDKVICSEVIEHIPKWERAVEEIVRRVKHGGRLVITTPNRRSLYGAYRRYRRSKDRFQGLLGIRANSHPHPYDEWMTQREVVDILEGKGIAIDKKVGICFIPSHFAYQLSHSRKMLCAKLTWYIERKARHWIHDKGYMIGVSGVKQRPLTRLAQ